MKLCMYIYGILGEKLTYLAKGQWQKRKENQTSPSLGFRR